MVQDGTGPPFQIMPEAISRSGFSRETPCSCDLDLDFDLDFDLDVDLALDLDFSHSLQNKLLQTPHL